jgi:glycosyltransferase involved in cell wall biosynthesis
MKIVLAAKSIYPFHPFGGVQKYVYHFAKYLSREGIDIEIIAPLDQGKPRTEKFEGLTYTLLAPSIYKYLEYPVGWWGVHLFSRSLARYLQKTHFDILHSFDMTGYQYLKVSPRRPVIAHVFTDNYLCNPISLKSPLNIFSLFASRFEPIKQKKIMLSPFASAKEKRHYWPQYYFKIKPMSFCLQQAERIFSEDKYSQADINTLFKVDPSKNEILPVGADIEFIDQAIQESSLTRQEIGLDEQDIVLITVNRLAADKGVDKILFALKELMRYNARIKLIIIGRGYQEKQIYKIIDDNGLQQHVRHFKDVEEKKLYKFYKISDIYISAFSYPGSSLSSLEAISCGLPLITTAQPWLVRPRQNGIILADNEPHRIIQAVKDLIELGDLARQGTISREIAEEYRWDKIARQAIQRYKTLLAI